MGVAVTVTYTRDRAPIVARPVCQGAPTFWLLLERITYFEKILQFHNPVASSTTLCSKEDAMSAVGCGTYCIRPRIELR